MNTGLKIAYLYHGGVGLFRTADIIAPTFGGALSRYWNPFEMWQDFTGGV
jgi:hypothetical protein